MEKVKCLLKRCKICANRVINVFAILQMSHEDDSKRAVINGVDPKPVVNKEYKQTLTVPPPKYYKLSDKDEAENEIREYKEKDRSKIIRSKWNK